MDFVENWQNERFKSEFYEKNYWQGLSLLKVYERSTQSFCPTLDRKNQHVPLWYMKKHNSVFFRSTYLDFLASFVS